jgi:hypothetical protein
MRNYVCHLQDDWVKLLPIAEFAYNNSFHSSIKMSPNEALYGETLDTRNGIEVDPKKGEIPAAKQNAEYIVQKRLQLEEAWKHSKLQQEKWYNKRHSKPTTFIKGQKVFLSSKNIATVRNSKKLDHRFLGPFEILEKVGKQAYKLKLPNKYSQIHPVFHVSLLQPHQQRAGEEPEMITPDLVQGEEEWEVEYILDRKATRKNSKDQYQYLVHWKGFGVAEEQWLPESQLENAQELLQEYNQKLKDTGETPELSKRHMRRRRR